jgi:hypothetical protein
MADAMSQDSDTGVTAEQLDAKYGDLEDASKTPPRDDDDTPPAWLDAAAAILNGPAGPPANNPPAAAPGAMAAALLPIRSESSQLVEQMGALAASAAAATPDNKPAGPSKTAAAGGKPGGEDDDTSADDSEEEDTRTEEQKEKDKLVEDITAEIARVEAAGYTFSKVTKWGAVSAYLDAKDLFEADGLDITDCANEKKRIVETAVRAKITELRAAEEEKRKAPLVVSGGDASQFDFGSEGEGEGEEEEEVEVPLPHSPTMYSYPYILCTPIPTLTRRATTKITASTTWRNSTSRSPIPRRCSRWLRRRKRSAR